MFDSNAQKFVVSRNILKHLALQLFINDDLHFRKVF